MYLILTGVVGTYCLLSYLFRKYPHLLHKQRVNKITGASPPLCFHISHRGGAGEQLENTMTAFDHAASVGTELFEIDCQLTKDGYVIVAHDNNLARLCGEDINISDTNYTDLPLLLSTQRLDFDMTYEITSTSLDRKLLLLEDLFARFPEMPMNVDIKLNNPDLIMKVAKMIKRFKREKLTIIGNSQHPTTLNVRTANPECFSLCSIIEGLKTVALYMVGLLPFMPFYADTFEIPMCSVLLEHFPHRIQTRSLRLLFRFMDYFVTNEKLINHLKMRGIPTYIFVLNAEHEWERALACGASGIMTDFPTKLALWMKKKGIMAYSKRQQTQSN